MCVRAKHPLRHGDAFQETDAKKEHWSRESTVASVRAPCEGERLILRYG
jgi:hypothetical protein